MVDNGVDLTLGTVRKMATQLLDLKHQLLRECGYTEGDPAFEKDPLARSLVDMSNRSGHLAVLLISYYGHRTQGEIQEEPDDDNDDDELHEHSFMLWHNLTAAASVGLAAVLAYGVGVASTCP